MGKGKKFSTLGGTIGLEDVNILEIKDYALIFTGMEFVSVKTSLLNKCVLRQVIFCCIKLCVINNPCIA